MKDFEEIVASCHVMLQALDKNTEWIYPIVEEVIESPKDQQQIWIVFFTTLIRQLIQKNPTITNHEWFIQNPFDIAKSYAKFHEEEMNKLNN